jgi:hypothetical protein
MRTINGSTWRNPNLLAEKGIEDMASHNFEHVSNKALYWARALAAR